MAVKFFRAGRCAGVFFSGALCSLSVFGLFSCNRSSIGCGIAISPGCFPQKLGAFFCYSHSPLTCGNANGDANGTHPVGA